MARGIEKERDMLNHLHLNITHTQIGSLNYSIQKITNASEARLYIGINIFCTRNSYLSVQVTNFICEKNGTRIRSLAMHFKTKHFYFLSRFASRFIHLEI